MAKYLIQANYVGDGIKGLLKEGGSARRAVMEELAGSLGGSVESAYYAFGDTDVYVILDMPDHASMSACALIASASGAVTVNTTVLMAPEEIDDAARKTGSYRPPGQ